MIKKAKVTIRTNSGAHEVTVGEPIGKDFVITRSIVDKKMWTITHKRTGLGAGEGRNKKALKVLARKYAALGDWDLPESDLYKQPLWEVAKQLYKDARTLMIIV